MDASLGNLTWPEVSPGAELLVVPVGALEQHGPHLPLDTDTRIAAALAAGLVGRRTDCVLGPALAYGASGEHQHFPGTVSIGQPAVELLVLELVRSATTWCRRVLLVCGHGGNADALSRALARLWAEQRDVRCWFVGSAGADAHAGRFETSLLLALAPDVVRLERAAAGAVAPLPDLLARLRTEGVRAVAPNGVLGDPAGASAAEGRRSYGELLDRLTTEVAAWLT